MKKKVYYNHLPPVRDVPDAEFAAVSDLARKEFAKLKQKLGR